MNYQRIYEQLTSKDMIADYTEIHHIIPRCMKGSDDPSNLVKLTPEAHFVAHQLLVKIYPGNHRLVCAALAMTMDSHGHRVNNKLFGWLRRKHANAMTAPKSAATKAKISAAMLGEKHFRYGKPLLDVTKARMSAVRKGKLPTDKARANMSIAQKNRIRVPLTDEHKLKISVNNKGRILPSVTCPYCFKEGKINGMKRFHFDNCKFKH